jgi:translation initiation factor 1A
MPVKKKGKKKGKKRPGENTKRSLEIKGDLEEYAKISKMLGDRRVISILPDSEEVICIIPGRFRKRCWMTLGDVILISNREFQDGRYDVIHKYKIDEIRQLEKKGEIPKFFLDSLATCDEDAVHNGFNFEEEDKKGGFDFEEI